MLLRPPNQSLKRTRRAYGSCLRNSRAGPSGRSTPLLGGSEMLPRSPGWSAVSISIKLQRSSKALR